VGTILTQGETCIYDKTAAFVNIYRVNKAAFIKWRGFLIGRNGDDILSKISPFKHFKSNYIVTNGAYDLPFVFFSVSPIIISGVGSYILCQ
jgi:hypothetical protein